MKRPETISEKLWRYRGVLVVVSIPLLLILTIIMLVPRSAPSTTEKPLTLEQLRHDAQYAIVLDAGSTGSRVHVFHFEKTDNGLKLVSDTFEQLKPGLSSYADKPKDAAESIVPLLETAVRTVPKDLQGSTPISLKATAGLRLLPGGKADAILSEVEAMLKTYPFQVNEGAVAILDGKDEGGFAWLTLNYLLGKIGGPPSATVAAIDLGGGSVQEAFALSDEVAAKAPEGYINRLKGAGKTYNVYVHSYLGYGLMAGRSAVISTAESETHPCFSDGYKSTYKYAGKDYPIVGMDAADVSECEGVSKSALQIGKACGADADECSFNGAWRGKVDTSARKYYVSSYFWDRATDAGIITDKTAVDWPTTPGEFAKAASAVCSSNDVIKAFPGIKPEDAPFLCLDLTFCHTILTEGFKLPDTAKVSLVKQVKYNGQNIEAAWPLGAAINDLSS